MNFGDECLNKGDETMPNELNFFDAIRNKKLLHVIKLVKQGADVNAVDSAHQTPLLMAVKYNSLEIVKFLIENNANINAATSPGMDKGKTPLWVAVEKGNAEIVEVLVKNKASIDAAPSEGIYNGVTPLWLALNESKYKIAKFLIDNHANVNSVPPDADNQYMTPIWIALNDAEMKILESLVIHGANVNNTIKFSKMIADDHSHISTIYPKNDMTLLCFAAQTHDLKMAKFLVEHGANVNLTASEDPDDYITPLWIALNNGNMEMVFFLIEHGADINATIQFSKMNADSHIHIKHKYPDNDATILFFAIYTGNRSIIKHAVKYGADVRDIANFAARITDRWLAKIVVFLEENSKHKYNKNLRTSSIDMLTVAILCRRILLDRIIIKNNNIVQGEHEVEAVKTVLHKIKKDHIISPEKIVTFEKSFDFIKNLIVQTILDEPSESASRSNAHNYTKQKKLKKLLRNHNASQQITSAFEDYFLNNHDRFNQNHLAFLWINSINLEQNDIHTALVKEIFSYIVSCRNDLIENKKSPYELDMTLIMQIANLMQTHSIETRTVNDEGNMAVIEGQPIKSCLPGTPRAFTVVLQKYLDIKDPSQHDAQLRQAAFNIINNIMLNIFKKTSAPDPELTPERVINLLNPLELRKAQDFFKYTCDVMATISVENIDEILNDKLFYGRASGTPLKKEHLLLRNTMMRRVYPKYDDFQEAVIANMSTLTEKKIVLTEEDIAYLHLLYIAISDNEIRSKLYDTLQYELDVLNMEAEKIDTDGYKVKVLKNILNDIKALHTAPNNIVKKQKLKNTLKESLKYTLDKFNQDAFEDAALEPIAKIVDNINEYKNLTLAGINKLLDQLKEHYAIELEKQSSLHNKKPSI